MSRLMRIFYILGVGLLIVVLLAMRYQYKASEAYLETESEKNANLTFHRVHLEFEAMIETQAGLLKSARTYVESHASSDYASMGDYLSNVLKGSDLFNNLYFLTVEEELIHSGREISSESTDLIKASWSNEGLEGRELILTDPFKSGSEEELIVTVAIPVYESELLLGFLAGDISLIKLQAIIRDTIELEKNSVVFLSENGLPLYKSHDFEVESIEVDAFIRLYDTLPQSVKNAPYGSYETDFGNEKGFYHFHRVGGLDWILLAFTPKSTFLENYSQLKWFTYIGAALVLIMFALLFTLQRRMVADPLLALEEKVEAIDMDRHPDYQIEMDHARALDPLVKKINSLLMKTSQLMHIVQEDADEVRNLNEMLELTIADLSTAESKVSEQKLYFEALFRYSDEAIAMVDSDHQVMEVNRSFQRLFGYGIDEIKGKNLDKVISNDSNAHEAHGLTQTLLSGRPVRTEGIRIGKGNRILELGIKGVPMVFNGVLVGGYAIYSDISERKNKERYLEYVSTHDDLTELFNRLYFQTQLETMDQSEYLPLGIIVMDVNGLKLINDALGTTTGDLLLRKIAHLMRGHLRPEDVLARIGGDEFGIILPNTSYEVTEDMAESLRRHLKDIRVDEVSISVSLGWADRQNIETPMSHVLKTAEDYMNRHKLSEGPSVRGKAIYAMINTLHEKNKREEQHSVRVSELSERLGLALGVSSREIQELKTMGLLHDIGKIAIREEILNKKGKLDEAEFAEIKKHPEIGYRILSSVNEMSEMADYVFAHHERFDGGGYPRGLKGEEIPYLARIICVTDAFDAMTSDRSYRQAMTNEQAFNELIKCAGDQFDPHIVKTFVEMMKKSV